jgi:hypothetical protein
MRVSIALCFALWLLPAALSASPSATEPGVSVHLVTIGPGPELFSRFGHIGLVVEDKAAQTMTVYNFGTFDFNDPNLRLRYSLGELRYWLSTEPLPPMVRYYAAEDREVLLRTLNLDPEKTAWLVHRLAVLALPENREYLYRHYTDNCCTRIRDLIDEAAGGAVSKAYRGSLTGRTFRDWTRRALRRALVSGTAIDFALGSAIDKPLDRWQEAFLPEVFSEDLDAVFLDSGEPLIAGRRFLSKREGVDPFLLGEPFDAPVIAGLALLLLLGVALPLGLGKNKSTLGPRAAGLGLLTWALLGGVGGLVLLLFWTVTTHYDTHSNENLLTFFPTHLWLLAPAFQLIRRGRLSPKIENLVRRYLLVSLGLVVVALLFKLRPFPQNNYGFLLFAGGSNVLLFAALLRTGVAKKLGW